MDSSQASSALAAEEYTVGWVCALPLEMAAAKVMLDQVHPRLPQDPADHNSYILGELWGHNVVVACLPLGIYGIAPAATVATNMLRTFRSIRFGLMVGIGGGVPSAENDIRLGDVVVSTPTNDNGGVIQYDRGKTLQQGEFQRTGSLNTPPQILLTALSQLEVNYLTEGSQVPEFLAELFAKNPKMEKKFGYRGASDDCLYSAEYDHIDPNPTCAKCDSTQTILREQRDDAAPVIHYGTIASGNQVIKDGKTRDRLSKELGTVLCFEMEAAGLQDFPCLVIRGICDYADSHKNKTWQGYAAATAAAFAKELLSIIQSTDVLQEKPIQQLVSIANEHLQVGTEHLQVATQQLSLSSEHLVEHKRTNQILENRPIDLHVVHEARYDSADVGDSPRCESGTRTRIRQTITQWADEGSGEPLFWLVGPAGTGKSTTVRTIADSFANDKRLAAGYFFKRGEQGRNSINRLFSTLAMQLADSIPFFGGCLRESLGTLDKDAVDKMSLEFQFEKLLSLPLEHLPPTNASHLPKVIVLDALDECESPDSLHRVLQPLLKLCNVNTIRLRVLFTSRPTPPITDAFKPYMESKSVRSLELHRQFSEDTVNDVRIFLKMRFSDIETRMKMEDPWPTPEELDRLVQLSTTPEPLFIYAATLVRFVGGKKGARGPKNQLKLWLEQCEDNKSQLHQMYDLILSQLFEGNEEVESLQQLQFLGALVLIATPLPARTLAVLLDMDIGDINWWLPNLHAVLDISSEPEKPIRLLHKSFSDFLFSEEGCGGSNKHRLDSATIHAALAEKCIRCMSAGLRQDMCDIRKPGSRKDTITQEKINCCIPASLKYACIYWVHHLQRSGRPLNPYVYTFLYNHFLHWLEVLSLLGQLSEGAIALEELVRSAQQFPNTPSEFLHYVQDAKKVLSSFGSIVERAPLQVYGSLLFFSPVASKVRQRFWDQRLPRLGRVHGIKSDWEGHLQTLERHSAHVIAVAFSPNGQLLASASRDCTVRLWNSMSGIKLHTLKGHSAPVFNVEFSPNSCLVASASGDRTIRIWNAATGAHKHTLQGHDYRITAMAFSPDSKSVISVSRGWNTRLWDMKTGKCQKTTNVFYDHLSDSLTSETDDSLNYDESHDSDEYPEDSEDSEDGEESEEEDSDEEEEDKEEDLDEEEDRKRDRERKEAFEAQIEPDMFEPGLRYYHVKCYRHIAFSPCTKLLASTFDRGIITIWSLSTNSQHLTLERHDGDVTALGFSSDGQLLASGSSKGELWLWDVATGARKYVFKNTGAKIRWVAFSGDAHHFVSASEKAVHLWNATTGAHRILFKNKTGRISTVASSPNNERLALVSDDNDMAVQLLDATVGENHEETVDIHGDGVRHILFSPDGQVIASASGDKTVRLWDAETGACRKILPGTDRVFFSPDNKLLAAASFDQTVRISDMGSFRCKDTITGYWGSISNVAYSPDGKLVASVSLALSTPQVSLWNAETGTLRQTLEARRQNLTSGVTGCTISAVTFSPDCRIVAALSSRSELWLWDATTGQHQQTVRCDALLTSDIVFSPDSQLIAVPQQNGWVSVFNRITCSQERIDMEGGVNIVAFSPDNQFIAIAPNPPFSEVLFVDPIRNERRGSLIGFRGFPTEIVFSPKGWLIAVASNDGFVRVWNIRKNTYPAILGHGDTVQALRFSPNGQTIATISRYRIRIWDVTTGTQRQIIRHDMRTVISTAFLPGELVVLSSNLESARFWNLWAGMAVETRRYRITPHPQEPRLNATSYDIGLNIGSTWITNGYEDLVWIPPEYRPTNWARRDATISMGCGSGRVIIFHAS